MELKDQFWPLLYGLLLFGLKRKEGSLMGTGFIRVSNKMMKTRKMLNSDSTLQMQKIM